jgi:hypothetical protein
MRNIFFLIFLLSINCKSNDSDINQGEYPETVLGIKLENQVIHKQRIFSKKMLLEKMRKAYISHMNLSGDIYL